MTLEEIAEAIIGGAVWDHHVQAYVVTIGKWVGAHLVISGTLYLRFRGK
jgi:hypothetical protein